MLSRIDNGHVLGVAAFFVPLIGLYAPLGLAPLIMVAAITALLVRRAGGGGWPKLPGFFAAICVLAIAWSAASAVWSIDPVTAHLSKLLRLALLLLAGLVLIDCARALSLVQRAKFQKLMIAGIMTAMLLLLIDLISEGMIRRLLPDATGSWNDIAHRFNRGMTILALMVWPAMFVLWRRSPMFTVLFYVVALTLVSAFNSTAAIAAIILGAVCLALTYFLPRIIPIVVAFGVLVSIFAGPFVVQLISPAEPTKNAEIAGITIPNSAYHRLLIWKFTADKIAERPILGWGFNSSKSIPGNTRDIWKGSPVLPLHPHNAWLQWWLELGVVGAALGVVLCGGVAWRLRDPDLDRAERALSMALLVATYTIGGVAYGAWQSWWVAAILFAAAFMVGGKSQPDKKQTDITFTQ